VVAFVSNQRGDLLRLCSKCKAIKVPEGGCQMSTTRWYCYACYRSYLFRK